MKKESLDQPGFEKMKYQLIAFDIDGTITRHSSSWRYLHERLGQWDDQAFEYQERFLAGKISYKKFCRLDAAHWKGMEADKMASIFKDIPYAQNVHEAVEILKDRGFLLIALSTGLQFIVDRVKEELRLDYAVGNILKVSGGRLTGGVKIHVSHLGKGRVLRKILKRLHIPPCRAVVVGDSAGDLPMMEMAGYSIAFNADSPEIVKAADYSCRTRDFMEVCRKIIDIS